jgi:hypothetical protein
LSSGMGPLGRDALLAAKTHFAAAIYFWRDEDIKAAGQIAEEMMWEENKE